jgi:hypothetical protein
MSVCVCALVLFQRVESDEDPKQIKEITKARSIIDPTTVAFLGTDCILIGLCAYTALLDAILHLILFHSLLVVVVVSLLTKRRPLYPLVFRNNQKKKERKCAVPSKSSVFRIPQSPSRWVWHLSRWNDYKPCVVIMSCMSSSVVLPELKKKEKNKQTNVRSWKWIKGKRWNKKKGFSEYSIREKQSFAAWQKQSSLPTHDRSNPLHYTFFFFTS